ncbi:DUF1499 domain-containing protein [Notoacmeibacter ruber]|uniref:DUF1499 domain-containing protein n=1 Tax=Notoacmeibacter ruber TaxID=2670375 RepID=A0A3L7JDB2_9HYPH|nr:DUF1499 domain-containing protein [Notoacmeibacter ruber]RLQ88309.1 DUF1499 domain-containing protein [Notoacmeibacter ruber]
MKIFLIILAILVAVAIAAFLGAIAYGRLTGWETRTRKADQGMYDFDAAQRSATDNDALGCTKGLCAEPDVVLPEPPDSAENAFARIERHIEADRSEVERVDDRSDITYRRYVVRTPLMRFPDTVDLRWSPEGWRAMSRSLLGRSDLGANEKRLRQWFDIEND